MLILGINSALHDSSVALVGDEEVLFAAAEERFSRIKHDLDVPRRALDAALRHTGASLEDLDGVAFGWDRPGLAEAQDLRGQLTGHIPFSARSFASGAGLLARAVYRAGGKRALLRHHRSPALLAAGFVDHHEAHAWSAFGMSGFEEAAVLVVDGRGAWQSTSIYDGDGRGLHRRAAIRYPNSLGALYTRFTRLLGFEDRDEWKLMGLAAYGTPNVRLDDVVRVTRDGYRVDKRAAWVVGGQELLEARFGARRDAERGFSQEDKDLAASVQGAIEDAMLSLVRRAVELTGKRRLCLAGGVAMNAKANGRILASGLVDDLFVQPAATDDGTAMGAAIALHRRAGGWRRRPRMEHLYLGPGYTNDEIDRVLRDARLTHVVLPDIEPVVAQLLARGFVVGWFQGRMEFGPRALGNRSILADPRDAATRDRVNASVKFREEWRPFAPACLQERAAEYFEPSAEGPYMIVTFTVRPEKRGIIPAVTHVDGSARVQTVRRESNPRFWQLIEEFGRVTGVPVVLNTSFNLRGEPIVCTPQDALRTYFTSGLDFLALGDCLLAKDDVRRDMDAVLDARAAPVDPAV
jgi:carbamoyltransferase